MAGLIAVLAAAAFALARWQIWAQGNIGRFIMVGRHFATPSQVPRGIPLMPIYGYDGQFFYRLALDPANLSRTAYGITMDRSYRYMRIGYPALTWLVSLGQHSLVPAALVAVNIVSLGAVAYFGAVFARQSGRHALAGLLLAGYFGLVTSLSRDTAEPLAAACLLAGLLAIRGRRQVLAAALLAFGALTRETVMVAVAALAIVRVVGIARGRHGPGRDDLPWVVPSAVFVAWQVLVKAATGSIPLLADGGRNAGAPFIAPLKALKTALAHLSVQHFDLYDLWLLEVAVLALLSVAALTALRSTSAPVHERLAFVLYLVEICVVTPSTWSSTDADLRSFVEVYLLALIILLGAPRRSIWGTLLPWFGAAALPALIVVTQHRLTGS
ncbi:MAG: AZOBR_p60025 family cell surface glycopolymer formation protein [Streptosporangiaceae bacterium]